MTKDEKELLIKDLCGRLPYGIIASVRGSDEEFQHFHIYSQILELSSFVTQNVNKPGFAIELDELKKQVKSLLP